MRYQSLCFLLVLVMLPAAGMAAAVGSVELPDAVHVKAFDRPLLLSGAGVRKRVFTPVYVHGPYLAERQTGVSSLLVQVAKRVVMRLVYHEVGRRQLKERWLGDVLVTEALKNAMVGVDKD